MITWLTLVTVLIATMLVTAGIAIMLMARMLLQPPRMNDGKAMFYLRRLSPADLGLAYENVNFQVTDRASNKSLRIAGWWMEHYGSRRCAIILHGWTDAKVGGIAWAPLLHSLGFNVLAIDLRAHGESGGKYCTAGFFERDDVSAVIDQIRAMRPHHTEQIILFGVSLGAAVALATAGIREDVAALILDSPFADYRRAAMAHADLVGLPLRVLPELAFRLAQRWSHARFDAVRPADLLRQIHQPVLLILLRDEALNDAIANAQLDDAIATRIAAGRATQVCRIDAPHALALTVKTEEYMEQVKAFLTSLGFSS